MTIVTEANYFSPGSTTYWYVGDVQDPSSSNPETWVSRGSESKVFSPAVYWPLATKQVPFPENESFNYFHQGSAYYRNEKEVLHRKQSVTLLPSFNGAVAPVPGHMTWVGQRYIDSGNREFAFLDCWVEIPSWDPQPYLTHERCFAWMRIMSSARKQSPISKWEILTPEVMYFAGQVNPNGDVQYWTVKVLDAQGHPPKGVSPFEAVKWYLARSYAVTKVRDSRATIQKLSWQPDLKDISFRELECDLRLAANRLEEPLSLTGDWNAESYLVNARYDAQGQVVAKMAEQVGRMTDNNIQLISELCSLIRDIVGIIKDPSKISKLMYDVKSIRTPKQAAKLVASARLSEQYGVKLTVRDVLDVADHIRTLSSGEKIARAACSYMIGKHRGTILMDEHWKMFYDASLGKAPAMNQLLREDLIGLQNVWDLIPYSFVVDWFAPVGDALQGMDDEFMLSNLPINCITVGQKATDTCVKQVTGGFAQVVTTSYTRKRYRDFPPYAPKTCRSVSANIAVNGAALIVQRL